MSSQSSSRAATNGTDPGHGLERPRYYPRQIIRSDDLTQGQDYCRQRLRRHSRALHGWGVVYGATVRPKFDNDTFARQVTIDPGFILTPQGDEIEITAPTLFEVNREPTPS